MTSTMKRAEIRQITTAAVELEPAQPGETYRLAGRDYPVTARVKMQGGVNVPLVDLPMMSDYTWQLGALKSRLEHPEVYDPETVQALLRSINILPPGASVELSTGEKALVLRENKENVLCPTVVSFRDNSILDLALPQNEDIQIVDVMKTMDNRYILKK